MNKKNGFTLIEMLVVVVILGILLAIVIPSITGLLSNEGKKKYNSHVKIVDKAAELYIDQYKGQLQGKDNSCFNINYSTLIVDGLLKEEDIKCAGTIIINKTGSNKLGYDDYLTCKDSKGNEVSKSGTLPKGCLGFNGKFKMNYQMYTNNSKTQKYDGSYYVKSSYLEFESSSPYTSNISNYELTTNINGNWQRVESTLLTSSVNFLKNYNGIVYVRAVDTDGNRSDVASFNIKTDNTGPEFNTKVTGDSISKKITISNVVDKQVGTLASSAYSYNGGTNWETSLNKDFTSGDSYKVCVRDSLENTTCKTVEVSWIDRLQPIITASDNIGSGSWHKASFDLNFSINNTVGTVVYNYGTTTALGSAGNKVLVNKNTSGTTYYVQACDSYGYCSRVSNYLAKLDDVLPTVPIITGGSASWTNGSRTISVSTLSTALSGIKNYQYYISTSSTGQSGGSWIDLGSGVTNINITTEGIRYIYFRAVNNIGVIGNVSVNQPTRIDTKVPGAPTVGGVSSTWATSRVFSVTGPSSTSGIKNYEYYISSSSSIPSNDQTATSTFTGNSITISTTSQYVYFRAVNNAGIKGIWTTSQNLYVDTATPAAPTITGGSATWINGSRTISVSAAPSSTSGIKNYQYYISTSSTSQVGGNWADCSTSQVITTEGTRYIYFRAVNNAGTIGAISSAQTTKIDTSIPSAPTLTGGSTTWINGIRTISVSAAPSSTSGIAKYQYYVSTSSTSQAGGSWADCTTSQIITTEGTRYIYFRAVNNAGTIGVVSSAQTTKIDTSTPAAPTVAGGSTTWAKSRTVTLTGPSSTSGIKSYEYFISNSTTAPATTINPTGTSGTPSITIATTGKYVFFRVVNNAETKGVWTTYQNLYVDIATPTAPTISGGSTTWINGSRTISVSTHSVALSGIKNYQYYISTSSTGQSGGSWIDLGSGVTSINITTEGTRYIYFRAVNNIGIIGNISSYQSTNIDISIPSAPTVSGGSTTWSTSRTLSVTGPNNSVSGIKNYEYYISSSSSIPSSDQTVTSTFTGNSITISTTSQYVYFRAVNNAGTKGSWTSYQNLYVDTITPSVPQITVSDGIASDNWHTSNFTLSFSGSSSTSGINYYYGTTNNPTTLGGSVNISDTTGTIYYVKACNASGKCSDNASYIARVDRTNPTVSYNVAGGDYTTSKTVKVTGSDTNFSFMHVHVYKDGVFQSAKSTTSLSSKTFDVSIDSAGSWVIYSMVFDKSGRIQNQSPKNEGGWYYQSYKINLCAYSAGKVWDFSYTGGSQSFKAPCNGTYKLETWGGSGGNADSLSGGLGGYSAGSLTLSTGGNLYIGVGGQGANAKYSQLDSGSFVSSGGYNGGGSSSNNIGGAPQRNYFIGGGGGGATHIAKNTNRGLLRSYASYTSEVLIVAGGGGGAGSMYDCYGNGAVTNANGAGGTGGGQNGGNGSYNLGGTFQGLGGTQYSGGAAGALDLSSGSFGTGSDGRGAGGAGWYGGGGAATHAGGGGGSGYTGGVSGGSMTNGNNAGNGKAKITLVTITN